MPGELILLVDDEANILELARMYLERDGFRTAAVADGEAALAAVEREAPALMVLDIMLPKLDGYEVCRRIRARSDLPIIMLTARDEDIDKILGLELGADDYLTKPFNPRELVARVKAILRRTERASRPTAGAVRLGDVVIDPASREVMVAGQPATLRTKEFDLLLALAENRGLVLSREKLLDLVWGFDFDGQYKNGYVKLIMLGARWYDPELGRFVSADSIVPEPGNPQAFNRYSYSLSNPLKYTDPSGHCPWCLVIGGVIIILKIVDYGWTAYDAWQAGSVLADPNASQTEKDAAALSLAMTVAFEGLEPDEPSPVSLPLDDLARKGLLKQLPLPGMEDMAPKAWAIRLQDLPIQTHHILTNKHDTKWTAQFGKIVGSYGLELKGSWNTIDIPHQGSHPERYHQWVMSQLQAIDQIAKGDQQKFLQLFNERIRQQVSDHPEMLFDDWWNVMQP